MIVTKVRWWGSENGEVVGKLEGRELDRECLTAGNLNFRAMIRKTISGKEGRILRHLAIQLYNP